MSDRPVERPPELWDRGCAADGGRNEFVVPAIVEAAGKYDLSSVIDIGCGSGYIAREAARGTPRGIAWRLLDYAPEMLAFARGRCVDTANTEFILHDLRLESRHLPRSQLGYVAYTFLDFPLDDGIARNVAGLIAAGGLLLVFMPDVLEDVIEAAALNPAVLDDYRAGHCSLEKVDKFTAKNVLFEANRVEDVIRRFLRAGLTLTELTTHRSEKGKFHYMLTFRAELG